MLHRLSLSRPEDDGFWEESPVAHLSGSVAYVEAMGGVSMKGLQLKRNGVLAWNKIHEKHRGNL